MNETYLHIKWAWCVKNCGLKEEKIIIMKWNIHFYHISNYKLPCPSDDCAAYAEFRKKLTND